MAGTGVSEVPPSTGTVITGLSPSWPSTILGPLDPLSLHTVYVSGVTVPPTILSPRP
jgi:hypothetical protein